MGLDIIVGKPEKLNGRDLTILKNMIYESFSNTTLRYVRIDEDETEFLEVFKDFIIDTEEEVYDINMLLSEKGYTYEDVDYQDDSYSYRNDDFHCGDFRFVMKDGNILTFNNVSTISIPCKGILYNKIGSQRKGANRDFYADGMWSSKIVVKKDVLIDHWNRYFSGDGNIEQKGSDLQVTETGKIIVSGDVPYGFGVEYNLTAEENRKRFKENIIDVFVEGETFVVYC
ncbi:MAG: hypothetical protein BWX59_01915 [Bacteroidetes bacterium ADurb.Bin028]|jgi:hypothetical protein|nr:MAG: hypothetical protein BWX59_01915 [Bacteroidetes bacterium ADurb.Bin028]